MSRSTGFVEIYDSTLRDGAQARGISYSVEDKLLIARKLDELGVQYIEGGWPNRTWRERTPTRTSRFWVLRGRLNEASRRRGEGAVIEPHIVARLFVWYT